ncbi:gas vesicle protein [Falsiroseomonas sp.]|uniref:gas vesicle protein n=1 Tax=Falsiroseomonas sp. TaxID=2870721 RepID=UPI003F71F574
MRDSLKTPLPPLGSEPQALVDVLDRLLDTGVVVDGQIVLSLAGVDLVHLGLRALLASVDRAAGLTAARPEGMR